MGHRSAADIIQSTRPVVPMIYSYETIGVQNNEGWSKIGYTEQDVETRINQQTHTAGIPWRLQWKGAARFDDEKARPFKDHDFHAYLQRQDVERRPKTEWFHISGDEGRQHFWEFRANKGVLETDEPVGVTLRNEQSEAVSAAARYAEAHPAAEFLWNAKPRFGKTVSAYELMRELGAQKVLVVTNRPAIANSWYDDYVKFMGTQSGLWFVSEVDALKGKPYVLTREQYREKLRDREAPKGLVEFVSLQDLKGAQVMGGRHKKLEHIPEVAWDVVVIDEAHEGVDTYRTEVAFDQFKHTPRLTLHLSGTPFKALADSKFPEEAIYNWTYADEQEAKRSWNDPENPNPYADLPQLSLLTYRMSDIVEGQVSAGMDIDGEQVAYAFDLNEFFATNGSGAFAHDADVDRFLDALTEQTRFPFSTPDLRDELKHTLWMLERVDSAKALAKKLKNHPVFSEYEVVLAAGDGRLDDMDETGKALDRVRTAIKKHDKTITLSVGQLTTGVTVPEWTAVMMLSNMKSPALYMQTAFRSQNPCLFEEPDGTFRRKTQAYVFDFDPARTLGIFEQFANDLYPTSSGGGGTSDERKRNVRRLLNFFPVIGEDDNGEMVELDAEKVLSIPRRIHSQEVVRRGFMSDFLFQNIGCVFRAPEAVVQIINRLQPVRRDEVDVNMGAAEGIDLNGQNEVEVPEEKVIGLSAELFGDKVYGDIEEAFSDSIDELELTAKGTQTAEDRAIDSLIKTFATGAAKPLVETAKERYGDDMPRGVAKRLERTIKVTAENALKREAGGYKIARNILESERKEAKAAAKTAEQEAKVDAEYDARQAKAFEDFKAGMTARAQEVAAEMGKDTVRAVETARQEAKKATVEDGVRDHLRGFARTIPSFLMAYGNDKTTLANFEEGIPEDVFLEVTSITKDDFRLLRDGGDVVDPGTGEVAHFDGHVFDQVVFDDSVREFMALRERLADYFDPDQEEDIFDYVPPQRTNQIFTPKRVVEEMVDLFEAENPGCFDDPTTTYADLYMKSGLFITEVVTRLYNSDGLKDAYPDPDDRLRHIFEDQVFGAAPTAIIHRIATGYILGPAGELAHGAHANFVCKDTAELAKEGKLAEWVEGTFGGKLKAVREARDGDGR